MKKSIRQSIIFYTLFVLMVPYMVYASISFEPKDQLDSIVDLTKEKRRILVDRYFKESTNFLLPKDVRELVVTYFEDDLSYFKGKTIEGNISNQCFARFDFTESTFYGPDLTGTDFSHAILQKTTCDYEKAFVDNLKLNNCDGGEYYKNIIKGDIKVIKNFYSKQHDDTIKAKLLHIACGLSRLPFYEGNHFYVKLGYWYYEWKKLNDRLNKYTVGHIFLYINTEVNNICWTSGYNEGKKKESLKDNVKEGRGKFHHNFDDYVQRFCSGYESWCTEPFSKSNYWRYYGSVLISIISLKENYSKIKGKQLKEKACHIASELSKSYQYGGIDFLSHFLFYQNQLIDFKKLAGIKELLIPVVLFTMSPKSILVTPWKRGCK